MHVFVCVCFKSIVDQSLSFTNHGIYVLLQLTSTSNPTKNKRLGKLVRGMKRLAPERAQKSEVEVSGVV